MPNDPSKSWPLLGMIKRNMAIPDRVQETRSPRPVAPKFVAAYRRAVALMKQYSSWTRWKACHVAASEAGIAPNTIYSGWDRYRAHDEQQRASHV